MRGGSRLLQRCLQTGAVAETLATGKAAVGGGAAPAIRGVVGPTAAAAARSFATHAGQAWRSGQQYFAAASCSAARGTHVSCATPLSSSCCMLVARFAGSSGSCVPTGPPLQLAATEFRSEAVWFCSLGSPSGRSHVWTLRHCGSGRPATPSSRHGWLQPGPRLGPPPQGHSGRVPCSSSCGRGACRREMQSCWPQVVERLRTDSRLWPARNPSQPSGLWPRSADRGADGGAAAAAGSLAGRVQRLGLCAGGGGRHHAPHPLRPQHDLLEVHGREAAQHAGEATQRRRRRRQRQLCQGGGACCDADRGRVHGSPGCARKQPL
jgi:hypothetical protein